MYHVVYHKSRFTFHIIGPILVTLHIIHNYITFIFFWSVLWGWGKRHSQFWPASPFSIHSFVVFFSFSKCFVFIYYSWMLMKLDGQLVERMHLRQRLSDSSVNKTILKPRLAPKTTPPIRVRGISRRNIPRCSAYTISEKEIWFRHPDYNQDRGLKRQSVRPWTDICRHATFHPNPCTRFFSN